MAEPSLGDTGNGLIAPGPAQMMTGLLPTPAGQRLVLTIRTSSATVTVFLAKEDAETWARTIAATAAKLSASGLIIPGNGQVP
jgi:hypothetical protein